MLIKGKQEAWFTSKFNKKGVIGESMKCMENWNTRLNPDRFRGTTAKDIPPNWNPFDSDYARIVMSAPFRRLQDKAQVFPLEPNDFVRTRLTHSIEVSSVARSLGVRVENWLKENQHIGQDKIGHIPSILATASLAHDIGNPPFGHFGEKCIQTFFRNNESKLTFLSDEEKSDLFNFDGNVQSLRLLLRLGLASDEYSYNLTFPTLATTVKYPKDSINGNKGDKSSISFKKYGYYQIDKDRYNEIDNKLCLNGKRHPLCFILESADDVCYSVSDIEDGFKKGAIDLDCIIDLIKNKYVDDEECVSLRQKIVELRDKYKSYENLTSLIIQDCRIFAQQKMINSSFKSFVDNHNEIVIGNYDQELLSGSKSEKLRKLFEDIAIKNFRFESVVKSELLGETVIFYLLERFFEAVMSTDADNRKTSNGKICSLLSHQSRYAMQKSTYANKEYLKVLMVVDFIAGMTDSYALSLYQNLHGMK